MIQDPADFAKHGTTPTVQFQTNWQTKFQEVMPQCVDSDISRKYIGSKFLETRIEAQRSHYAEFETTYGNTREKPQHTCTQTAQSKRIGLAY